MLVSPVQPEKAPGKSQAWPLVFKAVGSALFGDVASNVMLGYSFRSFLVFRS